MEHLVKKIDIQAYLRSIGCKTSFATRSDARAFLDRLYWSESFPWNKDQMTILDGARTDSTKETVVQGCFGAGKTTIMMALLTRHILFNSGRGSSVLLCAFNVSIRNELRRRVREMGLKDKPVIRTFDSLIYQVCRVFEMPDLDRPDYEGRRVFVEKLIAGTRIEKMDVFHKTEMVLVDEAQDLDQKALDVFNRLFPNARFFFFGDIFQCIQKEPRCCLLWHLLRPAENRRVHFMQLTPRVPTPILEEIKDALIAHYPEYATPIAGWYSTNPLQDADKIRWRAIRHYSEAFVFCKEFLSTHKPEDCMILTFSSAITVRGSMGDLSRFRQFLIQEKIETNRNYKSMEPGKLFLSTVNSSKGLERPHVLIILTFPLELAFANFSDDLVVNLVSVGLSRCKRDVTFCAPIYSDRFSRVFNLYPRCPRPIESTNLPPPPETIADFLEKAHSTTEILRQGILSFSTRSLLRSLARFAPTTDTINGERIKWGMRNEEEASFMGILYEVLITSLWTNKWPSLDAGCMNNILQNPMYSHCRTGISNRFKTLIRRFCLPYVPDFNVLYDYTEFHILLSQKIRVRIPSERKQAMKDAWNSIRADIARVRPPIPGKPQVNLQRQFATGIADMLCEDDAQLILYEIKTCSNSDWKDDAFTQAALYMSMTRKRSGRIRLFNPFRKEIVDYNISFLSKEKNKVLQTVDRELLLWNTNCFLAKFDNSKPIDRLPFPISGCLCTSDNVFVEWLASTKIRIAYDGLDTTDRQVIRFNHDDPFLRQWFDDIPAPPASLTKWALEKIKFVHGEERHHVDWEDPFSHAILVVCLLRTRFRM